MLKVEIHWRCTPVSLRNSSECCPDVAAVRQEGPRLQGGHNRGERGMFSIPPAFCLVYLYYINLAENPNRLLVVDVTKCSQSRKKEEMLWCQGLE